MLTISRVGSGFKNFSQLADTVVSRQILPTVDHIAGTGGLLQTFLEGRDERLP
jgi:hypothetical protein